ncbi:MAG: hypothetical protein US13_C0008G0010 [candidate division TM6 bacterium GW2011_GWE2_36_25]|nr:MAG: hypothetical protein US03_C0008G0028 [candidate division TM6 bacterium GW2011_GWF2_36_131]KKQ02937.1 MAG: hypothetical protein US13_C0008G0010 [candidate division TM6 bacterium GW2011_GWE2_36_25]KKQ19694.1 MAG: hypothetical protein US32_C0006G0028 [candidate division TM6 bacterium GW2011_GWA2_36_9]
MTLIVRVVLQLVVVAYRIIKIVTVSSGVVGNANFGFYAKTYKKSGLATAVQKRYCRTGDYTCPYAT